MEATASQRDGEQVRLNIDLSSSCGRVFKRPVERHHAHNPPAPCCYTLSVHKRF
jgi:hypothetical protein